MSDLKRIQEILWELNKHVKTCEDDYHRSMNHLQRLLDLKEQQERSGDEPAVEELAAEIQRADIQLNKAQSLFLHSKEELAEEYEHLLGTLSPQTTLQQLDDTIPVLLLPVRIETRFMTVNQGKKELWIRVFPDDIAVHTHEKNLTEDEVSAGKTYWVEMAKAGNDTDNQKGAWRVLAAEYGSQRAAWIAKKTKPVNWPNAPTQLIFPAQPDIKPYTWTRAPRSTVMPDRFVFMGYSGGTMVFEETGKLIPKPLILGPDPRQMNKEFEQAAGKLKVGSDIDWFMDFEQAIEKGMGIRIPLAPEDAAKGFDRVLVLGLRLSADEKQSQVLLEELIENHHYAEGGFSLLKQGTPTNNTEEKESGYSSIDPGEETSFAVETGNPLFTETQYDLYKKDGQRLAEFLGIESKIFGHIGNADSTDVMEAMCMNTALWPATLGYFLETLMREAFALEDIHQCRDFFTGFVTGRGAIPAIRVGKQPYGILPTSVLSRWKWSGTHPGEESDVDFLTKLFDLLTNMDTHWQELAKNVAYAGAPGDSFKHLLEILGLHASSVEFYYRQALGPGFTFNYTKFGLVEALAVLCFEAMKKKGKELLKNIGYPTITKPPYIFTLSYSIYHHLLEGPLVDNAPLSETKPIKPYKSNPAWNYIHWLTQSKVKTIKNQDFGSGSKQPNTLLYLMLRHALLTEYWDAAIQIHINKGKAHKSERREYELINIENIKQKTKWDYLEANANTIAGPGFAPTETIGDILYTYAGLFPFLKETHYLSKVKNALERLADLPTARLERVFAEHLDLCSYRLDAWLTAMIQRRLFTLRYPHINDPDPQSCKKGIYLGAFGILENLRPRKLPKEVSNGINEKLKKVVDGPVFEALENGGYIHGPSLNHAVTAAILRNAYLTHAHQKNADVMSVNLSSERVRIALSLLEGVRNGQSLSALLGYHFERGLHERYPKLNLDQYIFKIRKKFPLVADKLTASDKSTKNAPIETLEARNVVDGLALIKASRLDDKTPKDNYPFGVNQLPKISSPQKKEAKAIIEEIDRITNYLDGLGDLALAEGVFQVAQGNYQRAGAMMKAISEGSNIPDPEIIRTPRSGSALTSRVAVFLGIKPEDSEYVINLWPPSSSPRAAMEADMNQWLGLLLGDPDKIRCQVHIKDKPEKKGVVSLKDLNLQPIDFIYMIGNELANQTTELENRIGYAFLKRENLEKDADVSIKFIQRLNHWDNTIKTFFEILPLARRLQEIVTGSRPLNAEDLLLPNEAISKNIENPKGMDAMELEERLKAAIEKLAVITLRKLELAIQHTSAATLEESCDSLRAALIQASYFDMPEAFPSTAIGSTEAEMKELKSQAQDAASGLKKKISNAEKIYGLAGKEKSLEQKVEKYRQAIKTILGESFNVLPLFKPRNPQAINAAVNQSSQLIKQQPKRVVEEWIQVFSRVRPKMEALEEILSYIDMFEHNQLYFVPIQFPLIKPAVWVGVKYPESMKEIGEILSMVVHKPPDFDPGEKKAGLLIDQWVEVIPNKQETTGIAVHFNQPNSEPPQTLLLAVSPQLEGHWKWDDLVDTLHETLDRAKKRAVEPDSFLRSSYAHIMSGIMPAVSAKNVTISTDLSLNKKEK